MARTPKPSGRKRPAFESDISRSEGKRRERQRLLVVCGAKVTEKDYLQGLVVHLANPAVTVRFKARACSPSQLIEYAVSERERSRGDFDQIWCVFDVDEYDVATAVAQARKHGIEVAVSNPCFELWLILHFCKHTAYAPSYRALVPSLKQHLPGYDKARLRFRDFCDGWEAAALRARELAQRGDEHRTNPSTGVWSLVESIADR
jgi:hypothetical protein